MSRCYIPISSVVRVGMVWRCQSARRDLLLMWVVEGHGPSVLAVDGGGICLDILVSGL